ncbi:sulfatase-like hydrolase/transferase [Sandaracinus amylolyticus]|uniref:Choline-sulfatase n=1 Tax=Sandaracinus amylolyticus TaxID=927083 RepID=A0A0F6W2P0_9BACT|nr:sulfatase-like hydrolase/transferase [Sandaracinus amylolyticus]AKF05892.1 Choline-sulfatase [Sandaracinus amylolyticus]
MSVVVTMLASVVLAIADIAQSPIRTTAPRVGPSDFVVAALHIGALYVACGAAVGVALGLAVAIVGRGRAAGATLERLGTGAHWLRPDPPGVARVIATAIAAIGLFATAAGLHVVAVSRFHRADLAGYLVGAVVVAAAWVLSALRAAIAVALRPVIAGLGRAGTRASIAILALVLVVAVTAIFLALHPEILLAYDPVALAWIPAIGVAWIACAALSVARMRRARRARVRALAAVLVVLATVALLTSATTFGESNRVRSVVEQRSVIGRRVIRLLSPITDRDGDRYSWAFGGGDCDDTNASIHPGALDEPGDDVDQDCFGGDGSPNVVERGLGRFGAPVEGLAQPNFLVVTIDALRRDHLGAYGYSRPTSPNIDAFLGDAVDFREVVPQSSRSLRSIPAMWTGNYASEVAYGPEYLWPSLLQENVTAPELLRDRAGYETSVIMATDYFERMTDFFQGFEQVTQFEMPDPPRERAVNEALPEMRRLAASGQPWLLWVHLYNCHVPYLQDGVESQFGSEQVDLYDTEITLADRQFQRLLDALDELGLRDRTVVVLASDHGEGFGEHGTFGHSTTLYEEELRSLLAVRVPGVAARRVDQPVGLLDVAPTILNLARVEPNQEISGVSLVPFMTGEREPDADRPIFAELLPDGLHPYDVKVMRRGARKLMWWVRDGTFQYFDLQADPAEEHDLSDERRADALEMMSALRAWIAGSARAENRTDTFVDRNRLRAMPTVTHPVEIRYPGMFTVVGIDMPRDRFTHGEAIPLTFYYRVDGQIDSDLFFYVDIAGPPGVRIPAHFHAWHFPLHSRYPTSRWVPGEIVRDPTPIVIPEELTAPVRLHLSLRVRDGDRILSADVDGESLTTVPLMDLDVVPRAELSTSPR